MGYDVILQCEMDAFPAPAIDWVKGDTTMANDDRHVVVHFSKGETRTLSTLKVENSSYSNTRNTYFLLRSVG